MIILRDLGPPDLKVAAFTPKLVPVAGPGQADLCRFELE